MTAMSQSLDQIAELPRPDKFGAKLIRPAIGGCSPETTATTVTPCFVSIHLQGVIKNAIKLHTQRCALFAHLFSVNEIFRSGSGIDGSAITSQDLAGTDARCPTGAEARP